MKRQGISFVLGALSLALFLGESRAEPKICTKEGTAMLTYHVPYEGYGWYQGDLITFPGATLLSLEVRGGAFFPFNGFLFLRHGHSTTEFGDPKAGYYVAFDATLDKKAFKDIFGTENPALPLRIVGTLTYPADKPIPNPPGNYNMKYTVQVECPCEEKTWCRDADGDGHGTSQKTKRACERPSGYVAACDDACDDNPGRTRPYDLYEDRDGDGYGNKRVQVCERGVGTAEKGADCNDSDARINPETVWYADADKDGYGDPNRPRKQCDQPSGHVLPSGDCRDDDARIHPKTKWYRDADGDGFGDPAAVWVGCQAQADYVLDGRDCNDNDATRTPLTLWYPDLDQDGFGDHARLSSGFVRQCADPSESGRRFVQNARDLDDGDRQVTTGIASLQALHGSVAVDDTGTIFFGGETIRVRFDSTDPQDFRRLSVYQNVETVYVDPVTKKPKTVYVPREHSHTECTRQSFPQYDRYTCALTLSGEGDFVLRAGRADSVKPMGYAEHLITLAEQTAMPILPQAPVLLVRGLPSTRVDVTFYAYDTGVDHRCISLSELEEVPLCLPRPGGGSPVCEQVEASVRTREITCQRETGAPFDTYRCALQIEKAGRYRIVVGAAGNDPIGQSFNVILKPITASGGISGPLTLPR